MRRIVLFLLFGFAAVLAFLAWPFFGLYQLAQAVQSRDPQAIMERVDIDSVRLHVVGQILTDASDDAELKERFGSLGRQLVVNAAISAADARAAEFFTPETIIELIATGRIPAGLLPDFERLEMGDAGTGLAVELTPSLAALGQLPEEPFRYLRRWDYRSLSKFAVAIGPEEKRQDWTGLILRRTGLKWTLWSVELPQSLVDKLRPVLAAKLRQPGGRS